MTPASADLDAQTAADVLARLAAPGRERSVVVSRDADYEHFVRVDRHGRIMTGYGQLESLAALSAYASRMGDLIGELLQFGPCIALEASLPAQSLFVYRDVAGEIVGFKPHPRTSLRQLRARLSL